MANTTVPKPLLGKANDVTGLAKVLKQDFGENTVGFGKGVKIGERIPTGFFAFDVASNGGIPRGQCSIYYGNESSGKTTLALKTIAQHQALWPDKKCVYIDVEHTLDTDWAAMLGVDTSQLLVVHPHYGEQVVDIAEAMLGTDDAGIVVIDSLAAMISTNEAESSAEKAAVGGNSLLMGKLYRKTVLQLAAAAREGRKPTLLYINQVRTQGIGGYIVQDGMPGGKSIRFQAAMIVQCHAKPVIKAEYSPQLPYAKHTTLTIRKWKVPIIGTQAEYLFTLVPHDGIEIGQAEDWKVVSKYLMDAGHYTKNEKKGYTFLGLHADTQDMAKALYMSDPQVQTMARQTVVAYLSGKTMTSGDSM